MKKYCNLFLVTVLIACVVPSLIHAKTYTLSNGDTFDGTAEEYKYAEFLIDVDENVTDILTEAWENTAKKSKFPSLDKILSKTKVSGSAQYDSKTKMFTLTNQKPGIATVEIKHGINRTKTLKIINTFQKELEAVLIRYEKEAGVVEPKKVDKESDLGYMYEDFYDTMYDLGTYLGEAMYRVTYDFEGTTNKFGKEKLMLYSNIGKNYELDVDDKSEYYIELGSSFEEEQMFEHDSIPYKNVFINFVVDDAASNNTVMKFKITGIRAFGAFTAEEIWYDFF